MTLRVRERRMYHSRDENKQNWMACIKHGLVEGPVSQETAEYHHARGKPCPKCLTEVRDLNAHDPAIPKLTSPHPILEGG